MNRIFDQPRPWRAIYEETLEAYNERVSDLLEANNREVERRRKAEAEVTRLRSILDRLDVTDDHK